LWSRSEQKNAKIRPPLGVTTKSDFVFTQPRSIRAAELRGRRRQVHSRSARRELKKGDHAMIVIERDGRTVVITGWRAWVIAAVAVVVTTAVLAALAFLVLGVAVSMIAFLLIVIPAVAIVARVGWSFQPRRA
jgi:hypothetical protein